MKFRRESYAQTEVGFTRDSFSRNPERNETACRKKKNKKKADLSVASRGNPEGVPTFLQHFDGDEVKIGSDFGDRCFFFLFFFEERAAGG